MKQSVATIGIGFSMLAAGLGIGFSITQWLAEKGNPEVVRLLNVNDDLRSELRKSDANINEHRQTIEELKSVVQGLTKQLENAENDVRATAHGQRRDSSFRPSPEQTTSGCLVLDEFQKLQLGKIYEICHNGSIVTFHEFIWKNQPHIDGRLSGDSVRLYQGKPKQLPGGLVGTVGKIDANFADVRFVRK